MSTFANVTLAGARVLVAEAGGDQVGSAACQLSEAGAEVSVVRDGADAITVLNASKPEIVVAEVRWPHGCGFTILEAARRLHPRVPVILFTANPDVNEAVHAMREGAESYLPKPFGPELARAVRLAVDRGAPAWPPLPGATFAEIERHAILKTYEACGRSPQKTAAILGLSARTIHYRLREYSGRRGRRIQSPDNLPGAMSTQPEVR